MSSLRLYFRRWSEPSFNLHVFRVVHEGEALIGRRSLLKIFIQLLSLKNL